MLVFELSKCQCLFNHMQDIPLKTKFVRGVSYITGFLIRRSDKGCVLDYITQSDPKGNSSRIK